MKTKITYILSNIDKAIAFEWIAEKINHNKYELSFILLHQKEPYLYNWLKERDIPCFYIPHVGKKSFFKIFFLLKKINPNVVHTHLFDANLFGLFAAKLIGVKKRIYTRHHSTYHHEYYPKAVKWDKFANALATDIVAISENVKNVLVQKEQVSNSKIHLIHHGFDLSKFKKVNSNEVELLKKKYQLINSNYPVVGVISRHIKWKGIVYIISAFKDLLIDYPNAKLVLANAFGPDKEYITSLLKKELATSQYIEIPFESNLFALYQLFDVYVHVPINKEIEAFGQTYVEALAAGIPSVFTLSGVANEFVVHQQNALVVDYCNSESIRKAVLLLLNDKALCENLKKEGLESIKKFNLDNFVQKLETLYA
ncbi:MAG: glycosyltransferase family 4 protein [Flavobacteriales bacterium]